MQHAVTTSQIISYTSVAPGASGAGGFLTSTGRTEHPMSDEPRIYRIIRFRFNAPPRTTRSNVTLTEAQSHCSREDTHGVRAGVRWFDGYDYMRGYRPAERS